MPKRKNFSDPDINSEFDNIYATLDLYIVGQTQPLTPKMGTMWFNPDAGTLKIWNGKSFITF